MFSNNPPFIFRKATFCDAKGSFSHHHFTGMDVFTKDKRSKIMAAIRSKNTRPEIIVRKYLFSKGFRYRINHPRLPGHPDIVLRKYRTCIFVNGCFWHGHDCPKGHLPKTNNEFWRNKINRNRERDAEEQRKLAAMGWHCITVWECELANNKRDATYILSTAPLSTNP